MSMKRTNVYADPADLEIIKRASERRGIPEAEIIRSGIHLAALAARQWDTPIVAPDETVDLGGPVGGADVRGARSRAADAKSAKLESHR